VVPDRLQERHGERLQHLRWERRDLKAPPAALVVRPAAVGEHEAIWRILEPIIRAGETYALPRDMPQEEALAYWFAPEHEVFVAEDGDDIVSTYYLRENRSAGAGIANCGYMTAPAAFGRGVARAMCAHSIARAKERGFRAMRFNFVVATNERAVRLWQSLGFDTVERLPGAFRHPTLGAVDALVMHRAL
jgi:ribosomal protein S18 acetylase RimI-like enzyme